MVLRKWYESRLRGLELRREQLQKYWARRLRHIEEERAKLNHEYNSARADRQAKILKRIGDLDVQRVFATSYQKTDLAGLDHDIAKVKEKLSRPTLGERMKKLKSRFRRGK